MARSFIVLLLLIVCFLFGMVYGLDRGNVVMEKDDQQEKVQPTKSEEKAVKEKKEAVKTVEQSMMNLEASNHFTQKAASLLEAGVKGFYEVITQILYQVAQLFF